MFDMKESIGDRKKRVLKIFKILKRAFPGIRCALHFKDPWQLLVATILSAQCTDKRVNLVTPALFKKYPTLRAYLKARPKSFQQDIRSTGFYKNKARNILAAAKAVLEKFHGEVPPRMEDLVTLPGVGRKTANVILGNAFGIPGISVDTHMIRINRLLGLTRNTDPVKIEFDLMELVPRKDWTLYSHLIIHHGRVCCFARKPDCPHCPIILLCPSAGKVRRRGMGLKFEAKDSETKEKTLKHSMQDSIKEL